MNFIMAALTCHTTFDNADIVETIQSFWATYGEAEEPKVSYTYLILGPGNVGLSLACWLEKQGHKAILYVPSDRRANFDKVWAAGSGALKAKGKILGDDQLYHPEVTHDLAAGLKKARVIAQTIPAHAREGIEKELSRHQMSKKTMVTIPDNGSSLKEEQRKLFKPQFMVGFSTSPFGCRIEDGQVFLKAEKLFYEVSIFQTMRADRAVSNSALEADLKQFPANEVRALLGNAKIDERPNALVVDLSNPNPQTHLPPAVFNIGAIENPNIRFNFYAEGMSDGVLGNTQKADDATIAIGAALDFDIRSQLLAINLYYGTNFKTFKELATLSISHNATKGDPQNLEHRYFVEDGERAKFRAALAVRLGVDEEHVDNLKILYKSVENARGKEFPPFHQLLAMHGLDLEEEDIIAKYGPTGYLNTPRKLLT